MSEYMQVMLAKIDAEIERELQLMREALDLHVSRVRTLEVRRYNLRSAADLTPTAADVPYVEDKRVGGPNRTVRKTLLEALRMTSRPMAGKDLRTLGHNATGVSKDSVGRTMTRMRVLGLIEQNEDGLWVLTRKSESGRRDVSELP